MEKVFMVHLRQPDRRNKKEMRSDPFWEFGSFGCTGCHGRTLMHPKKKHLPPNARLAFCQGGQKEFRLVCLTPPIGIIKHTRGLEARWNKKEQPFCFKLAPLLINNRGETNFPSIKTSIRNVNRQSWCGRFSSKYRTVAHPLEDDIASEIVSKYMKFKRKAGRHAFINSYVDALPRTPPLPDENRGKTYRIFLRKIGLEKHKSRCKTKCCS